MNDFTFDVSMTTDKLEYNFEQNEDRLRPYLFRRTSTEVENILAPQIALLHFWDVARVFILWTLTPSGLAIEPLKH